MVTGVLAAVLAGVWGLHALRDWRATAPYRSVAMAELDRIGMPTLSGAQATNEDNWRLCQVATCAVAVRSVLLPTHPTLSQVKASIGAWTSKAGLPTTAPANVHPFGPGGWYPLCYRDMTQGPGGPGCISGAEVPGPHATHSASPPEIVFVAVRFADPNQAPASDTGHGTFRADNSARVSELSVAVVAYKGPPIVF